MSMFAGGRWEVGGGRCRALAAWLVVLAATAAESPVLLPWAEALKRLDPAQPWVAVPLADWQRMTAVASSATGPAGAWIESARVRVRLGGGPAVMAGGELEAVNPGGGPRLARLFWTAPAVLGMVRLDGAPALLAAHADRLDLVVPPGRHRVELAWEAPLGEIPRQVQAADRPGAGPLGARLFLPAASAVDWRAAAEAPGELLADGLVRDAGGWRLTGAVPAWIDLAWAPGRLAGAAPVFGAAWRIAVVRTPQGERRFRAELAPDWRRGDPPPELDLVLPPGWTAQGDCRPGGTPDRIRVALQDGALPGGALEGWIAAGAAIALPALPGAAWVTGEVLLAGEDASDWDLPAGWRVLPLGRPGQRRFAVPGTGSALALRPLPAVDALLASSQAVLACGPQRWRLEQTILVRSIGRPRFAVPVALPAGWKVAALAAPGAEAPAPEDCQPGTTVSLALAAGTVPGRELPVSLSLEREAPDGGATVALAAVPGAERASTGLTVLAAPGLEAALAAPAWRQAAAAGGGQVRATLLSDSLVPVLTVAARVRPPDADAEGVVWLLAGPEGTWARIDLRLRVRGGELGDLELAAPVRRDAALHAVAEGMGLVPGADVLRLTAARPWRGERLVRIEGRLAPEAEGRLAAPRLRANGADLPVRWTAGLQAPAGLDLEAAPGAGVLPVDPDELPGWAAAWPGEPVLAAWRLGAGEPVGWTARNRPLASAPAGFLDAVEVDVQLGGSQALLRLRARVAAPGRQDLPLDLHGAALLAAAIDGVAVAPRQGASGLVLPLPGRTQAELVLLLGIRTPAGGRIELPLPDVAGLPVTASRCRLAAPGDRRIETVGRPGDALLASLGSPCHRRPWGGWEDAEVGEDGDRPLVRIATPVESDDPRRLVPVAVPPPPPADPGLELRGQLWSGSQPGMPQRMTVEIRPLADLAAADRWGRILALALGLLAGLVVRRGGWPALGASMAGSLALAGALLAWQVPCGPLLALAEWYPAAVLIGALLRWALARVPARPAAAMLMLMLMLLTAGGAGAGEEPVLMGYARLSESGVPQDVRVLVARDRLDALWRQAGGGATTAVLATGAVEVRAVLDADGAGTAELRLPLRVLGGEWQTVRLVPPGAVASVELRADAGSHQVAWRAVDAGLAVDLPPGTCGVLTVRAAIAGGQGACHLPAWAPTGGELVVEIPAIRIVRCAGRPLAVGADGRWRCLLPAAGSLDLEIAAAGAARPAGTMAVAHRVRATLAPGRLEWQDRLRIAFRGDPPGRLALRLPADLLLTRISGDALAGWRQEGAAAQVTLVPGAPERIELELTGLLPRGAGPGTLAPIAQVEGAVADEGRLGLVAGDGARFRLPEGGAGRAQPADDEQVALAWQGDPGALRVAWDAVAEEPEIEILGAVVADEGGWRAEAAVALGGRGAVEVLRLRLPPPWRPALGAAERVVEGPERHLVVRPAAPAGAGQRLRLSLRAPVSAGIAIPDLAPIGGGVRAVGQTWVLADTGRLRIAPEPGARSIPLEPAQVALTAAGVPPPAGARIRAALGRDAAPAQVRAGADEGQPSATLSHYLILGAERVRWSLRLAVMPAGGTVETIRLRLPPGAALLSAEAPGLGSTRLDAGTLTLVLAAPAVHEVVAALEFAVPLAAARVRLAAPLVEGMAGVRQQVVLAEEDDLGLVTRRADGLDEGGRDDLPLPQGVDAAAGLRRWRALRPDWSLELAREPLMAAPGVDGVAALVDAMTVLGPDGERRSRAVWHVANRSRQQLPLALPDGAEVWEVRVDGRVVRLRQGDDGRRWVPVRPLRPGEAGSRIEVAWRERGAPDGGAMRLPRLEGLKVQQAVWRLAAPAGWSLAVAGGTLTEVPPEEAVARRARAVVDELRRLGGQSNLAEAALRRQADQLARLDQEFADRAAELAPEARAGLAAAAGRVARPAAVQAQAEQAREEIAANRAQIARQQQDLTANFGQRSSRRSKLGLDNLAQNWVEPPAAAPVRLPPALPWDPPLEVSAGSGLGAGDPPPGWRAAAGNSLLGIGLVPSAAPDLACAGQGEDLMLDLRLAPPRKPWWPWLLVAVAAAGGGAAWFRRRSA